MWLPPAVLHNDECGQHENSIDDIYVYAEKSHPRLIYASAVRIASFLFCAALAHEYRKCTEATSVWFAIVGKKRERDKL